MKIERKSFPFRLVKDTPATILTKATALPIGSMGLVTYSPPADTIYGELIKGYCSTWDLDTINDRIKPGAFAEAIQEDFIGWIQKFGAPFIKGMRNHEELSSVLHKIVEDEKGVYIEFWCLNTAVGRDYYVEIKSGAICQMSFGFCPSRTQMVQEEGVDIREIVKLRMFEYSGVLWACNEATEVELASNACESVETKQGQEETKILLPEGETPVKWAEFCENICKRAGQELETKGIDDPVAFVRTLQAIESLSQVIARAGINGAQVIDMLTSVDEARRILDVKQAETPAIAALPAAVLETPTVVPSVEDKSDPTLSALLSDFKSLFDGFDTLKPEVEVK